MCFSVQQNNKQTCKKHVKNVLKPLILWIELSPSPIFYCGLWTFANSTSYSSFVLDLSWDFATSLGLWQARSTAIWNRNGPYWYRKKNNWIAEWGFCIVDPGSDSHLSRGLDGLSRPQPQHATPHPVWTSSSWRWQHRGCWSEALTVPHQNSSRW